MTGLLARVLAPARRALAGGALLAGVKILYTI